MRFLHAALILACLLCAPCAWADQPTIISTAGFSITFPAKWHLTANRPGTILADQGGGKPPFIIVNYADPPAKGDDKAAAEFQRFKDSTIADILQKKGMKMVSVSSWHVSETIQHLDGTREERLDFEIPGADEKGKPVRGCGYVRFFHNAPGTEVYFAFLNNKPCEEGWTEFRELVKSIVWKTP